MCYKLEIKGKVFHLGDRVWSGINYGEPDQETFVEGYVCFGEFTAEIYTCYGFYVGDKNGNQVSEAGLTEEFIVIDSNNHIKDNPVPSLDNKLELIEDLKEIVNDRGGEDFSIYDQEAYIIFLDSLLQNGVETNKEQPNNQEISSIQRLLLNKASEKDASIVDNFLEKNGVKTFD